MSEQSLVASLTTMDANLHPILAAVGLIPTSHVNHYLHTATSVGRMLTRSSRRSRSSSASASPAPQTIPTVRRVRISPAIRQARVGPTNDDKRLQCGWCAYQTENRQHMTRHVMRHTQEKPFRCPYCPHRFSRNDALKNHVKIHVTENPLQCTDCKFMATTLEDLKNHEKQDHKHACKACSEVFSTNKSLRCHEAKHCSFRCKHCKFSSIYRKKVEGHVRLEHSAGSESIVEMRLLPVTK